MLVSTYRAPCSSKPSSQPPANSSPGGTGCCADGGRLPLGPQTRAPTGRCCAGPRFPQTLSLQRTPDASGRRARLPAGCEISFLGEGPAGAKWLLTFPFWESSPTCLGTPGTVPQAAFSLRVSGPHHLHRPQVEVTTPKSLLRVMKLPPARVSSGWVGCTRPWGPPPCEPPAGPRNPQALGTHGIAELGRRHPSRGCSA